MQTSVKVYKKKLVSFEGNHFNTGRTKTYDFTLVGDFKTQEDAFQFVKEKTLTNPDYIRLFSILPGKMTQDQSLDVFLSSELYYQYQEYFIGDVNKIKKTLKYLYENDGIRVIQT
jgi:hypothetical protein